MMQQQPDAADLDKSRSGTSLDDEFGGGPHTVPVLPTLPATVPPPPLQVAVVPMVSAQREGNAPPLTARPLQTLGQQVSGASVAGSLSDRQPLRSVQGLAALRMIRRTAPVVQ